MPPRYLKNKSPTRLKPCQERTVAVCDLAPADGCCGVLPCKLCIEWESYDGISYGSATLGTSFWTGTVGDFSFVAYWEVGYASGECEFVVLFGGEEVYRGDCYGGISCRNPGDETYVVIGYDAGTLRWSVYEPRELHLIDNPDTGCRDHFCGGCRCSCQCLCVTITEYDGDVIVGEICDTAYECDPPVWAGLVGYYDLSLALGRDEEGDCIILATVDGEEQDTAVAVGCGSMTATIVTSNGTTVEVVCKECSCTPPSSPCQCDGRCNPLTVDTLSGTEVPTDECANPLPVTLTVDITSTSAQGGTCFSGTGTITFKTPMTGGLNCWEGDITGSCTDCNGTSRTWTISATVCCVNELGNLYSVRLEAASPGIIDLDLQTEIVAAASCDPLLLDGCIPGEISGFVVACIADMPPTQQIFTDVCFQVYETP